MNSGAQGLYGMPEASYDAMKPPARPLGECLTINQAGAISAGACASTSQPQRILGGVPMGLDQKRYAEFPRHGDLSFLL